MPGEWSGKKHPLRCPSRPKRPRQVICGRTREGEAFPLLTPWQFSGHRPLQPRWRTSLLVSLLKVSSLKLVSSWDLGSLCPSRVSSIHQLLRAGVLVLTQLVHRASPLTPLILKTTLANSYLGEKSRLGVTGGGEERIKRKGQKGREDRNLLSFQSATPFFLL